jgi:UrcA family protein
MLKTLTALALLAAPIAATAQTAPDGIRVPVAYTDLNLSTGAGVAELDRRISRAVDKACPPMKSLRLSQVQALQNCKTAAYQSVAATRAQVLAARTGTIQVAGGR